MTENRISFQSFREYFRSARSTPEDEQLNLAKRVHLVGALAAIGSSLFYFFIYLQTGAWQSLANSIGVALAMVSIGAGYISLLRGNKKLTATFGLSAVILAYVPGELFWAEATIYNLTAGVILLILVAFVLQINLRKWATATSIFVGLVMYANLFEPFERYNINLSPALSFYIPFIAISLTLAITWQLARVFQVGRIRTRLVIAFLAITIVPLLILTTVNNRFIQNMLIDNSNQSLLHVASESAETIDDFVFSKVQAINSVVQISAFGDYLSLPASLQSQQVNRDPIQDSFVSLQLTDQSQIISMALLDRNGINIFDSNEVNEGNDESLTEYFQVSYIDGNTFTTDVVFTQSNAELDGLFGASIFFSTPIIGSGGEAIGVLRIQYNASVLQDIMEKSNDVAGIESFGVLFQEIEGRQLHIAHGAAPESLYTTLIEFDDLSQLQSLQDEGRMPLMIDVTPIDLPELHHNLMSVEQETFFTATDLATGNRLNQVAILRLSSNPNWIIAFFQPQDIFLSAAQQQSAASVALVIIISLVAGGAAVIMSQIISRPITRLTEVAQIVASGDFSAKAIVESNDEIGILAGTFNSMTEQLDDVISNLEDTISERTQALERRAAYLESAAEVGRTASDVQDLDEMLVTVAQLIGDRFGFYHVGILLIEETGKFAVLRAANSEGGWRMIARDHKLRVGEQGIVGSVTSTGEARIEQSVAGEDTVHFANPELPYTRSEMALPLISGDEILGALDVQSTEEEAFTQEDVTILQVLADQVAMAIGNKLLLARVQESIEAERRAFGELSSQAWVERLQMRVTPGFISDESGISKIDGALNAEAKEALESGRSVAYSGDTNGQVNQPLAVPIKIHGNVVLGLIETHKPTEEGPWTSQEIELLESIGDQLGSALENARLFEETQRQAERERIAADVSSQVWSSTDVNSILQTAVNELGRALNASKGTIRLTSDEQDGNQELESGEAS